MQHAKKCNMFGFFVLVWCLCNDIMDVNVQPHPLAQCNDVANQIYQSMRQSNGSNFFLNRKDTIVIYGYLNKKSMSIVYYLVLSFNRPLLHHHRLWHDCKSFQVLYL